jgi:cell division septum initiation protein DivIVA
MVVKAELEAAETSAAKKAAETAEAKLAKLESELQNTKNQAGKLEEKASSAETELAKAKEETSKLEREVSQVKASFKTADNEALKLRQRVDEAEKKLKEFYEHHTSAWLPHWLQETAGKSLSSAGVVLKNATSTASTAAVRGSDIAITVFRTKVLPITLKYVWKAKTGGVTFAAVVAKRLAEKNITVPPAIQNIYKVAAEKAKSSKFGRKAQKWSAFTAQVARKHFSVVVTELESLLVQAASVKPSLAPFAQKPTSTIVVYFVLFAPLIAIGMPLLASLRSKGNRSKAAAAAANASSIRKQGGSTSSQGGGASSRKTPLPSSTAKGGKKR